MFLRFQQKLTANGALLMGGDGDSGGGGGSDNDNDSYGGWGGDSINDNDSGYGDAQAGIGGMGDGFGGGYGSESESSFDREFNNAIAEDMANRAGVSYGGNHYEGNPGYSDALSSYTAAASAAWGNLSPVQRSVQTARSAPATSYVDNVYNQTFANIAPSAKQANSGAISTPFGEPDKISIDRVDWDDSLAKSYAVANPTSFVGMPDGSVKGVRDTNYSVGTLEAWGKSPQMAQNLADLTDIEKERVRNGVAAATGNGLIGFAAGFTPPGISHGINASVDTFQANNFSKDAWGITPSFNDNLNDFATQAALGAGRSVFSMAGGRTLGSLGYNLGDVNGAIAGQLMGRAGGGLMSDQMIESYVAGSSGNSSSSPQIEPTGYDSAIERINNYTQATQTPTVTQTAATTGPVASSGIRSSSYGGYSNPGYTSPYSNSYGYTNTFRS